MNTKTGFRWFHVVLLLPVFFAVGAGGWYGITRATSVSAQEPPQPAEPKPAAPVRVEVVRPAPGGIQRVCVQPGSVEPFESADLFAKASGFLAQQAVDIGSRVKKGDVLARISVPEYEKQVQRDAARVRHAEAQVKQMEAHLVAARAESKAADAAVALAAVMVRAKTAYRQYREKQLNRMKELAHERAIEARVVDEQEDYYLAALEAENSAKEGVNSARERAAAARAKVDQAAADLDEVKAGVEVAAAELEKSRVLLDYTVVTSPYTGVVTSRTFHVGDFIKSADQGGTSPVLSVERTDLMRVVVQVPDRDVPYVRAGSPAVVEIDALPGDVFASKGGQKIGLSRWADAEDPATRTMRTEIDVPNPDGKLRHGMYGRVTITLAGGTPSAVRVPSAALVGKAEGGHGSVRIVRDGKVHIVPVRYATDNGVEVEIISGLSPADEVIARAAGPVEEGTAVTVGNR